MVGLACLTYSLCELSVELQDRGLAELRVHYGHGRYTPG